MLNTQRLWVSFLIWHWARMKEPSSWAWWHMPITPALGRPEQEDCKVKSGLIGYLVRSSLKKKKNAVVVLIEKKKRKEVVKWNSVVLVCTPSYSGG